ncbi:MAG: hypothetical protein V1862_09005 [Methanobacteriota archaeon]
MSSELSWDGEPPIAVVRAAVPMMVLTSVLNDAAVGALTDICPTVSASAFSYTIRPEYDSRVSAPAGRICPAD